MFAISCEGESDAAWVAGAASIGEGVIAVVVSGVVAGLAGTGGLCVAARVPCTIGAALCAVDADAHTEGLGGATIARSSKRQACALGIVDATVAIVVFTVADLGDWRSGDTGQSGGFAAIGSVSAFSCGLCGTIFALFLGIVVDFSVAVVVFAVAGFGDGLKDGEA